MARYFFHVHNRTGDLWDNEGQECPDLAVARAHALLSIRSLLSEEVLDGKLDLHGHLDVVDSAGAVVVRTAFTDAVTICTE